MKINKFSTASPLFSKLGYDFFDQIKYFSQGEKKGQHRNGQGIWNQVGKKFARRKDRGVIIFGPPSFWYDPCGWISSKRHISSRCLNFLWQWPPKCPAVYSYKIATKGTQRGGHANEKKNIPRLYAINRFSAGTDVLSIWAFGPFRQTKAVSPTIMVFIR